MLKRIIIGALAAIIVVAIGFSAYNVFASNAEQYTSNQAALNNTQTGGAANRHGGGQWNTPGTAGSTTAENVAPEFAPQVSIPQAEQDPALAPAQQPVQGITDQTQGNGRGNRWAGNNENASAQAIPQPQNGYQGSITFQGTVSDYIAPKFTLVTSDGQAIPVQLGNLSYMEQIGLSLQNGEQVIVTGFYDTSGGFAATQITLLSSGATYVLRDEYGRPSWAGGPNH